MCINPVYVWTERGPNNTVSAIAPTKPGAVRSKGHAFQVRNNTYRQWET
jgi:hypothetical protein